MVKPTARDMNSWFETVWDALWEGQDREAYSPDQWDEICTAMAWIAEAAGHQTEEA